MKKEKYVFNSQTLQYETLKTPIKLKLVKVFGYFSSVVFASILLFSFSYYYLPSPKEKALEREIKQMEYYYSNLSTEFQDLANKVDYLQSKDADVHRIVFGLEPIDPSVWNGGTGGHDKYLNLTNYQRTGELLLGTLEKVDRLKRKIDLQSASFEELLLIAKDREDKLASIPSIKPVQENKLRRKIRYLSGFGWRLHPVHKVKKFHYGIDFTAPTGTPIQSTGKGVVKRTEKKKSGYGYSVVIDHGYGYETLYGHMSAIDVKRGDKVTKGQKIGTVGSTGTSTAPHCHYEVRLNGKPLNPIDYCLDGLTPGEYQELAARAMEENQSFD